MPNLSAPLAAALVFSTISIASAQTAYDSRPGMTETATPQATTTPDQDPTRKAWFDWAVGDILDGATNVAPSTPH